MNNWIDVKTGIPQLNVEVLVCDDEGDIDVLIREDFEKVEDGIWYSSNEINEVKVIAWMPLPKPYIREDEDE